MFLLCSNEIKKCCTLWRCTLIVQMLNIILKVGRNCTKELCKGCVKMWRNNWVKNDKTFGTPHCANTIYEFVLTNKLTVDYGYLIRKSMYSWFSLRSRGSLRLGSQMSKLWQLMRQVLVNLKTSPQRNLTYQWHILLHNIDLQGVTSNWLDTLNCLFYFNFPLCHSKFLCICALQKLHFHLD